MLVLYKISALLDLYSSKYGEKIATSICVHSQMCVPLSFSEQNTRELKKSQKLTSNIVYKDLQMDVMS